MKVALLPAFLLILPLMLLPVFSANAARLDNPYLVEIPVASQSASERSSAENQGMLLLLQRLTGQDVSGNPRVQAVAGKVESYVLQFGYQPGDTSGTYRLRMAFAPQSISQLLQEAGLVLWPLDRPQVLVVMVNEQAQWLPQPVLEQQVLKQEAVVDAAPVAELVVEPVALQDALPDARVTITQLQNLGRNRGVPLLFSTALLGALEQPDVSAASVQALDAVALAGLATRENADALLLGSVAGNDAQGWQGNWLLHFREQDYRVELKAASFPALFDAATKEAALRLSSSYRSSVSADSGPAQLRLQVDNIKTHAAYKQLLQYLEGLEAVQQVTLVQINGTRAVVDVDVKGRESFRALMALFRPVSWQEEIAPPVADSGQTATASAPAAPVTAVPVRAVWRYQWLN